MAENTVTSPNTKKPVQKVKDVTAVEVKNATKFFNRRHDKSLKQFVVNLFKRKGSNAGGDEKFKALDDVSFNVREGEAVALVGLNGSGKSTMLKIISGVLAPDSGSIKKRGDIAGLIEVGAGFQQDLTGRDNVYLNAAILGMSKEETDEKFDSIVEFSEIGDFIDTEVRFYSSGMYLRLAFSVAIHTEPQIFLVDEILSVGDVHFKKKCMVKIQELIESGRTLVVVSHELPVIENLCERAICLRKGKVVEDGPVKDVVKLLRQEA